MTIISPIVGKNPLEEMESKMQYLGAISNNRTFSVYFQSKPFNITVIQVYTPTTNAENVEAEWFYEDLQDILELTQKRYFIHHRGLKCKSRM